MRLNSDTPDQGRSVRWIASSRRNPCPVCNRTKDGDCRVSCDGQQVICHHPKHYRPSEVIQGWAFTGNTKDGRAGHFVIDKAREDRTWIPPRRLFPPTVVTPLAPVVEGPIQLQTCKSIPFDPDKKEWLYGLGQKVIRIDNLYEKRFIPHTSLLSGSQWVRGKGKGDWPLYGRQNVDPKGMWVLEVEGEKCADVGLSHGIVTVSQPGHDHTPEAIEHRYRELSIQGIVYIADNDQTGEEKAHRCSLAAAHESLPFLKLSAKEVFPGIPDKGSIDDVQGEILGPIEIAVTRQLAEGSFIDLKASSNLEIIPALPFQPQLRKRTKVHPDEALQLLPERLGGHPRRNVRSRSIHIGNDVLSADRGRRIYIQLCNSSEVWSKEATADCLEELADLQPFDPVEEYIRSLDAQEPLPQKDWEQLDRVFFDLDDEIARKYMPRYAVASIARVLEPGCLVRELPMLIGGQGLGKTELGRALFGDNFYGSDGLTKKYDVDDVTRLSRVWCMELGEFAGYSKRDQEPLKNFLTKRSDIARRKYAVGQEEFPRRSVFWGTTNSAPFRDATGSTRFVAIPIRDGLLPFERVRKLRDHIWKKAFLEYQNGLIWRPSQGESQQIKRRNEGYEQQDPWREILEPFVDDFKKSKGKWFIKASYIYDKLEIAAAHQNTQTAQRIHQIMEGFGLVQAQRRDSEGKPQRGWWP